MPPISNKKLYYITASGEKVLVGTFGAAAGAGNYFTFTDANYRRLRFDKSPSGDLLTWLEKNATKQASDTAVQGSKSVTVSSSGSVVVTPDDPYDALKKTVITVAGMLPITIDPTEPRAPKENDIWIQATPYKLDGSYVFASDTPSSPTDIAVWFPLETEGQGIIRKAYVYDKGSSKWIAADAYIYTGEKWVQIATATYYLINGTDKCLAVTGGWNGVRYYWSSSLPGGVPTVTWADGGVSITASSTAAGSLLVTENAIDVTSYSEMVIECESASDQVMCQLSTGTGDKFKAGQVATVTLAAGTNTMDLSALTGNYYIGIQPRAQKKTKITQILLR